MKVIPRCFEKETVVIIGSGPSLTKEDVDYCRGKAKVAVINDNYKLAPWADLLYAADNPWWQHHNGVPEFLGQKWTQDKEAATKFNLHHVDGKWNPGISTDPTFIHYGWNSGYQCCNLIFLMGAKKIILLGFDMQRTNEKRHWFGDHPDHLNKESDYKKWALMMDKAADSYKKYKCQVINCSRETALKNYERKQITDCL